MRMKMTVNESCECADAKDGKKLGGAGVFGGCAPPDEKVDSVRVEKLLGDHGVFSGLGCGGQGDGECAPGTAAEGGGQSRRLRPDERIEDGGVDETKRR